MDLSLSNITFNQILIFLAVAENKGFLKASSQLHLSQPLNTVVRSTALVIIGLVGVANLTMSYWIFFAGSCIAILMIAFIKIPKSFFEK